MIQWRIVREIIRIALPAVGEMTLYMMIWILDTMMVGQYGGRLAVSSVGLSTEIIYSFFNILIAMGLSSALTSLISRALGAKNLEKAEAYAESGWRLSLLLACFFFGLLFYFPKEILLLAGAQEDILPHATRYAKISAYSFFLLTISASMNGIFRGAKDTKTSLWVAAVINIFNLSFDYLLIFGRFGFPELGVEGAAIATVIGNAAGLLFQWTRLHRLPFRLHPLKKTSWNYYKEILFLGIPSALQEANFSLSKLLGVIFIMSLGSVSFAANQICVAIEAISFMPGFGIAIANTALVGHSIGALKAKRARVYSRYSAFIASFFMGIIALAYFFLPEFFMRLFIQEAEQEVIAIGILCLKVGALEQIPMALAMVFESYFRGAGDTKTPFYVSFLINWCVRVPLSYYCIYVAKYPIYVFWGITTLQWSLEALVIYLLYRRLQKKG